jgi:cytochrome P450
MSSNHSVVPGPKPADNLLSQINLALEFDRDAIGLITGGFRDYGDVWQITAGGSVQFMFAHPDHLHEILLEKADKFHKDAGYKDSKKGLARFMGNGIVTSDGEFWKRQRRLIQPAFHAKRIESYAETMVDYTLAQIADWQDGAMLDVDHEMMSVTFKIIAKAVFDFDATGEIDAMNDAMGAFQDSSNNANQMIPAWVPTPLELRTRAAVKAVDKMVYRLINERRAEDGERGDLVTLLLAARDEDGNGMSDLHIRDELVTLMMAGHETTANTMNWTLMLLAQYPDVEAALHEELDRVLGGRAPTLADLRQLPYTERVIKESMRLYPSVFAFGRQAMEDVEIGGYAVPKGASVNLFTYVTHRDPRWWGDDAEQFKPERWTADFEKDLKKYAYLPFSMGPRVCIGNSFAMMEAQLILATIAQRWKLRLQAGQVVQMQPLITLRPKGGLRMRAIERVGEDLKHRRTEGTEKHEGELNEAIPAH